MTQTSKCRGVATSVMQDAHSIIVTYHNTMVVRFSRLTKTIVLDTGGWKTATTKTRMNQASNEFGLGFQVFQKKGEWFVSYKGQTIPFVNESISLREIEPCA